MFKFRLLLLFVGVCGVILGTDSYTYPATATDSYTYPAAATTDSYTYPTAPATDAYTYPAPSTDSYKYPATPAYGYGYPAPVYPSYPSYGNYGKVYGYGSSNPASCANSKVIAVLDQIFCQHANKKRYSSTIYPTIESIIEQLEWTYELIYIQDVYDYVVAAIHELKTLQDAVYGLYYESSLLEPYEVSFLKAEEGQAQSTTTENARTNAAKKLAKVKEQLSTLETKSKQFKTRQGVDFQQAGTKDASETETDTKKRSERAVLEVLVEDEADQNPELSSREKSSSEGLLSKARASRSAYIGKRKIRGAEYSDYTCSYLTSIYCSEDKYDELLYNMLERMYTSLNFLWEALWETSNFMDQVGCEDPQDKEALEEAAIYFGALLTSFSTLIKVTQEVEVMYEIMELDNGGGSGSYYRAGGSGNSYSSSQQSNIYFSGSNNAVPYITNPSAMLSYPYNGYVSYSQPASSSIAYSLPQQHYRVGREAVTHAFPHVFLVG